MNRPTEPQVAPALKLTGINKHFGDSHVLKDVSIDLGRGKVVALLGENGSGKSTLIKILSGYYTADAGGSIEIGDQVLPSSITPEQARAAGLRFVHQDLGLVESMSVRDNVCFAAGYGRLTAGAIRRRAIDEQVRQNLARLDLTWDPRTLVSDLSPAQRAMLAIARVIDDDSEATRVLVLDEPTASLPAADVAQLFEAVRKVTRAGGTVLYVSHRIDEVLEIADDLIVLRDGRVVSQRPTTGLSHDEIITLLLGRELGLLEARSHHDGTHERATDEIFRIRGLAGNIIDGLDLEIRHGEILGIAGLGGCGRSELARLIAGAQVPAAGVMFLEGRSYAPRGPRQAIRSRVTYVPEDRHNHGCIGDLAMTQNLTLLDLRPFASPFHMNKRRESREARGLLDEFDIRPRDAERPIGKFSGGNQQKAVLAKALRVHPKILILDEPSQGIDIGAKTDIAARILSLAARGTTVVVASSDNPELAALCDRVIILDRGRLKAELSGDEITADRITITIAGSTSGAGTVPVP